MQALPEWFDTNDDFATGMGISVVTTDSILICMNGGGAIRPVTSGQMIGEVWEDGFGAGFKDGFLEYFPNQLEDLQAFWDFIKDDPLKAIATVVSQIDIIALGKEAFNDLKAKYDACIKAWQDKDSYAAGHVTGEIVALAAEVLVLKGIVKCASTALKSAGSATKALKAPKLSGNTTLANWIGKTGDLAKTSPVKIPEQAIVKTGTKAAGYDQISYKWIDNGCTFEARWHTKTSGAPVGQGNTWVVSKVTPGTPTGQLRVEQILVGDKWVSRFEWQAAINAYQKGTLTSAQEALLRAGHWPAP